MLLALAGGALVLALLPAAVGVAILVGTTVPLEFGAAAGLAILAAVKLAAVASGLLAVVRTPHPPRQASGFD